MIARPEVKLLKKFAMAPYHILIVIISSVIPENLVLLTKSEQSGPKSAHIRPTISRNPVSKTKVTQFNL